MALRILHHPTYIIPSLKPNTTIKSQSSPKPTSQSNGQGFGTPPPKPGKKSGRRERGEVIRRAPVENPQFFASEKVKAQAEEKLKNESGFLLTWLGLGGVIFFQGIALSVSGFLPEEWDNFLVKYLYPTFTPTVFLFVAGTVTYGVLKYLQNEKLKN